MFLPTATYRVQLNSEYTFKHLKEIIPYLNQLGITTIYASPITASTSGSTHGYDVINPDIINLEIGTRQEFEEINALLSQYKMTWLQDIVPNHMSFDTSNTRLMDVLERGKNSAYYNYFDINWNHPDPSLKGKLMVPFLGNELDECIEKGEVKLVVKERAIAVAYFDNEYPAAIYSYASMLSTGQDAGEKVLEQVTNLINKSQALQLKEWTAYKENWWQQLHKNGGYEILQQTVERINDDKEKLKQILQQQNFQLTFWKVSEQEIDYRRFFTVNSLICLRMEDQSVFNNYHMLLQELYNKGFIQGVRIDHIDGLYNPKQYVNRLRKTFGEDCYIIAEKILEYHEDIAEDWDLQGTSGYEFLSFTNKVLTSKTGAQKLLSFYKNLVPSDSSYEELVYKNKLNFLYSQMNGELDNLLHYMDELDLKNSSNKEANIRKALAVLMASFPVYRVYPDALPLSSESKKIVAQAFERAYKNADDLQSELHFFQSIFDSDNTSNNADNKLLFLMRLMQFTGPLAAKGVEDTTFYVYNPMISHNEVGDSPSVLGINVEEFHQKMISRQQKNPFSLNTTSTHDTKRGEDARMRLNVIAEFADEWMQLVMQWRQMNKGFIKNINEKNAPDTNEEYFIYHSLIGSFPEHLTISDQYLQRLDAFIEKALREAKVNTNYGDPNTAHEDACKQFIKALLSAQNPFLQSFTAFLKKLLPHAALYSAAQTLIKITAPGIPDIYQGCELWDLSLVDPDNRRPVDYNLRRQMLENITTGNDVFPFIKANSNGGAEKMFVTHKALSLRKENHELFSFGNYIPLQTNSENVIVYARNYQQKWAIIIVPLGIANNNINQLSITLPTQAPENWRNAFTGQKLKFTGDVTLDKILNQFQPGLLVSVE